MAPHELAPDRRRVEGFRGGRSTCYRCLRASRSRSGEDLDPRRSPTSISSFIEAARGDCGLSCAADYLVMAACGSRISSRALLLPTNAAPVTGPSAEDMATRAGRSGCAVSKAIRESADANRWRRPQLGRDVFPAADCPSRSPRSSGRNGRRRLYDLLSAYATQRQRGRAARVRFTQRTVWSLRRSARRAASSSIGIAADWGRASISSLIGYLVGACARATGLWPRRSRPTLEMVREGHARNYIRKVRSSPAPIYMRKPPSAWNGINDDARVCA